MNKISVVLTYYNGSSFFVEQLNSLLNQTKPFDELLILDDCSKAEEFSFLKKTIDFLNDSRIVLIRNEKNLGYAENFVKGCSLAKGDFIFLCDQDDIWDNNKISSMIEEMLKNEQINLLCSDIEPFYETKKAPKWDRKNLETMKCDGTVEAVKPSIRSIHLQRSGSSMCLRRAFLNVVLQHYVDNWAHDDFFWKCAVLSDSCAILHEPYLKRRIHENNTSEIKIRTKTRRIRETEETIKQLLSLKEWQSEKKGLNDNNKIIDKLVEGNEKRLSFLSGHNPFLWFPLFFKYKYVYPRSKGLYLDLFLFFWGTYKRK